MTSPFTLTSRISAKEFAGVSLRMSLRTDPFFYLTMLFGFGLVWGCVLQVVQDGGFQLRHLVVCLLGLFGLYCFAAPLRRWLLYKRQYARKYPQLRPAIEFGFYEDRFTVKAWDGEAEIPWSEVAKLWKVGHFIIILLRKKQGTYYVNTRNISPEQVGLIQLTFRESCTKR
ncbi:MAG TPA: YcxB family protein [Puia sp.]|nr:YcxB family protein [Puia sp.]